MIEFFIKLEKISSWLKAKRREILKLDTEEDPDFLEEGPIEKYFFYFVIIPCLGLAFLMPGFEPGTNFWIVIFFGLALSTKALIEDFKFFGKVALYRFIYTMTMFTGLAFCIEFLFNLLSLFRNGK